MLCAKRASAGRLSGGSCSGPSSEAAPRLAGRSPRGTLVVEDDWPPEAPAALGGSLAEPLSRVVVSDVARVAVHVVAKVVVHVVARSLVGSLAFKLNGWQLVQLTQRGSFGNPWAELRNSWLNGKAPGVRGTALWSPSPCSRSHGPSCYCRSPASCGAEEMQARGVLMTLIGFALVSVDLPLRLLGVGGTGEDGKCIVTDLLSMYLWSW